MRARGYEKGYQLGYKYWDDPERSLDAEEQGGRFYEGWQDGQRKAEEEAIRGSAEDDTELVGARIGGSHNTERYF